MTHGYRTTKGYGVRPMMHSKTAWECYDIDTGLAVLSGVSNQEAWRELDKLQNEAKSRAEDIADWFWRSRLD